MAGAGVHRLDNIETEEVSLVDRAANKRRFLVVKKEGTMLQPDGKGGFTRVAKAAAAFGGNKAPPFGANGKPGGDDAEDEEKAKAKKAEDEAEEKRKAAADAEEEEKRKKAMGSSTADGDDEEAEKAKKSIGDSIMSLIETATAKKSYASLVEAHKSLGEAIAKGKSFFENDEEKKARTSKAGAKMAGRRLELFQKAMTDLSSILAELMETPAKESEHKPQAGDPQMRQPNAVKSADAQLAKLAQEALEIAKSKEAEIAKANAEIDRLKKSIPASNATQVERARTKKNDTEVEWPLDMNRPIDRESVDKSTSFFDD